ncbi:MAG: hypothetical protein GKS05_04615 [Nitrospirales bacterium]|nr:hypothetical protein [Nitrospirales bacterium]
MGPAPVLAYPIMNLQAPQGFIADPSRQQYFIANANGEPGERDNNGFITKLKQGGEVSELHFIQGGRNKAVLHSPYGMAIIEDILFVADLDAVKGFDAITGEPLITISLKRFAPVNLTGLTVDPKGRLLVSDPESNAIYRIDPQQQYAVSLFLQDDALAGPSGLVFHHKTHRLIVTSFNQGIVLEIDSQGSIRELVSNGFFSSRFYNLSGVDFDQYGNMYISDLTAGKIWRIRQDHKMEVIAEFLISPASVSIDREQHLILVPYLYANGAEINGLERPTSSGTKKKQRTFSDYGFGKIGEKPSK